MTNRAETSMKAKKQKRLEKAGWKVGTPRDFLGLSPAEEQLIELKLELSQALLGMREKLRYSQEKVAKLLGSSQSRVAKMEAGDASVSLDLLVRSFFVLGGSKEDVGRTTLRRRGGPRIQLGAPRRRAHVTL